MAIKQKILKSLQKIVYKGNLLSEEDCVSKINFERYLDNNYIIKDNTPNEILNFVKKY